MGKLDKAYNIKLNEINKKLEEAIKETGERRIGIIYCAYDHDEYDIPIDNLMDVPVRGKVKINCGEIFHCKHKEAIESKIMNSPTWLQIAVEANEIIQSTNNRVQIHLEDIESIDIENGIKNVTLYMW